MNVTDIEPEKMHDVWPHVAEYFRSFEDHAEGELTAGELLADVIRGRRKCWIAHEGKTVKACALTEVLENPKGTVVLNFCAGEDYKEWAVPVVNEIRAWARHIGSHRVRAVHRPGWHKVLREMGFRETHRVSEIDIEELD